MNLLNSIRSLFGRNDPPSAPKLRNRPGGMAWIRGVRCEDNGSEVMNGRAVKTVRLDAGGLWVIDPPQEYRLRKTTNYMVQGITAYAGDLVAATAMADEFLEPWKEDGVSESEVRDLYRPQELVEVLR
jgi:hypothetical protein